MTSSHKIYKLQTKPIEKCKVGANLVAFMTDCQAGAPVLKAECLLLPHLWAFVAAMTEEKYFLIVCRLVPILLLAQPRA
jgi:hypothetical protein